MTRWTLLVFMAADNDLGEQSFAMKDLHEMERIGSSDDVAVVVQIDRHGGGSEGTTLRGLIARNVNWQNLVIETVSPLEDIGATNTGDPAVLRDFVVWGATEYPAEKYMLVIWAHGTGWRADEIETAVGKAAGNAVELAARSAHFGDMYQDRTVNLLFRRTMETAVEVFIHNRLLPSLPEDLIKRNHINQEVSFQTLNAKTNSADKSITDIFSRAVAIDHTDMSALDSMELKRALTDAMERVRTSGQSDFCLSIIAFDACLMGGIETLFQLREVTDVVIASEEEEPRTGWNYDLVVARIQSISSNNRDLAAGLVEDYITAQQDYIIRLVTQSALITQSASVLVQKLNEVGAHLNRLLESETRAIQIAEKTATRFRGDKDFLDIGHFLTILYDSVEDEHAKVAFVDAKKALDSAVINSRYAFARHNQAPTGLSVYFPAMARYDSVYDSLDVRQVFGKWVSFIKDYHIL